MPPVSSAASVALTARPNYHEYADLAIAVRKRCGHTQIELPGSECDGKTTIIRENCFPVSSVLSVNGSPLTACYCRVALFHLEG